MIELYNVFSCFFRTWSNRFFCCSSIRYSRYTQCDVDPRWLWYLWWDIIFETRQCLGHFVSKPASSDDSRPTSVVEPTRSRSLRRMNGGETRHDREDQPVGQWLVWVLLSMLVGIWASSNLHLRFPLLVLLGHLFWCIRSWQSCVLGWCGSLLKPTPKCIWRVSDIGFMDGIWKSTDGNLQRRIDYEPDPRSVSMEYLSILAPVVK